MWRILSSMEPRNYNLMLLGLYLFMDFHAFNLYGQHGLGFVSETGFCPFDK